jgi:hypothetical protein
LRCMLPHLTSLSYVTKYHLPKMFLLSSLYNFNLEKVYQLEKRKRQEGCVT